MNDFVFGLTYPFRCIGLFFRYPKIIGYSLIPMIINLFIYTFVFYFSYTFITDKSEELFREAVSNKLLLDFISFVLSLFTLLLVLFACYFLFIIFGGLVSAPFNEKISKHIESNVFGITSENNLPFFRDIAFSIKAELKKLLFYFSFMIPLILIDFIPMIGSVITLIFGSGFSFYFNALDYLDYPMTRRMLSFRKKLKSVNSNFSLSMGFGCTAFFLTFLPVINVLLNPVLVTAGTSLFYEKGYDKKI